MTAKAKFISVYTLGCFLLMINVSGKHRNEEAYLAPGPIPFQESAGIPIAVTGTLIDGMGAGPIPDAVVIIKDGFIAAAGPSKRAMRKKAAKKPAAKPAKKPAKKTVRKRKAKSEA